MSGSRSRLLDAMAITFGVLPFAFGLIRAVTTGQDVRYLWVAAAGFLGAALVTAPARSREGSTGTHIATAALAFVAATVLAVFAAIVLGTRFGPGLLVVGGSFGLCFAAASLLHLQARS
jgi:hypothetical protein